jgi:hypothetical protein
MRAVIVYVAVLLGAVACGTQANEQPLCRPGSPTTLMAESVPSASLVPCVRELPEGWSFQAFSAREAASSFTLEQHDGGGTLDVSLTASCPQAPASTEGVHRSRRTEADGRTVVWTTTFPGGCSVATLALAEPPTPEVLRAAQRALGTIPASDVVAGSHGGP